jgi:O-antigen ligase
MRLGLGEPLPAGNGIELTPFARGLVIALMAVLCVSLGALMDVTILVMALGLFNIGVIVFLLLRRDITWGFLFYLTTAIFFQTGFWIRLPGFPDLYPARVVSILLFLVFFIQILLGMRRAPRLGATEKAMLVFLVVMFISIVTSGQRPRWQLLMKGYIYPFMFYYFARAVVHREAQLRIVFWFMALLGIYFALNGIFEKLKWYELVWPKFIVDPTVQDHGLSRLGYRVRGIFLQPAILGLAMTMGFFPAWLYLSNRRNIPSILMQLGLFLTTPLTIFFTQTRSVYLGFLAALVVAATWSRRMRPMAVAMILCGMLGVFLNWDNLGSEDREKGGLAQINTIHYRVNLAIEAFEIFIDHPFFGVGFMNLEEAALDYRRPRDVPILGHIDMGLGGQAISHNILITIIAEQGALGLVPYLLIFILLARKSVRVRRDLPPKGLISKDYVVAIWCAYAAYIVNAMSLELRYFEYVNVLFFFLMGSMAGLHERILRDRAREEEAGDGILEPAQADSAVPWRPLPRPAGEAT